MPALIGRFVISVSGFGMAAVWMLFAVGNANALENVSVGDLENTADSNGFGAVDFFYHIGTYEVTNVAYASFLNAVAAASDPYGLYNPNMATDARVAGIVRGGESGSYTYQVIAGAGQNPVTYVNWFDAARFANWMVNGATAASGTETGAYTLDGSTSGTGFSVQAGATWWIPSEDEWYKAAYYAGGGTDAGYWLYPTQSDSVPDNSSATGSNQANYYNGTYFESGDNKLSPAGTFVNSPGAYGTFDMAGNVWEWNDSIHGSNRGIRGGSAFDLEGVLRSTFDGGTLDPSVDAYNVGFRLASSVPEPEAFTVGVVAAVILLTVRRRMRRQAMRAHEACG